MPTVKDTISFGKIRLRLKKKLLPCELAFIILKTARRLLVQNCVSNSPAQLRTLLVTVETSGKIHPSIQEEHINATVIKCSFTAFCCEVRPPPQEDTLM